MKMPSILDEVLDLHRCAPRQASHFVLCKGERMRYLIDLRGGTKHLVRSVASYGGKLALLLRLLPYVPFRLLRAAHLGYYAQAKLCPPVMRLLPADKSSWNMLIGTYDEKQKLVLQCFTPSSARCTFIKVGNQATEKEMRAEISFLRTGKSSGKLLEIPKLLAFQLRAEGSPFNMLVSQEFHGSKIPAELTKDICSLWREIAAFKQEEHEDGLYEFSHGDFTPWNLRKTETGYIVFDWEHCGMAPHGYDLVYFGVVTRLACKGMTFDKAFADTLDDIRRFIPDFTLDKALFYRLLTSVITPDGF